jgi:hypothetical protein
MYPCSYRDEGCEEVRPLELISKHEANCTHRQYTCPFRQISELPCGHSCNIEELKEHVLRDHSSDSVNMDAYECPRIRSHFEELSPTASFNMALVVFGELFHAVWRVAGGTFCCNVIHIGPENSPNYKFRFSILQNNYRRLSCFYETKKYIDNVDEVMKPENSMTIDYWKVEKFFVSETDLPFELEISQGTWE